MKKITTLDRFLLLVMCLLAAYQVVSGVEGLGSAAEASYSVGFGVLLVAGLLIIILGFEALESPIVVVISSIIPLGLSLGLVVQYIPALRMAYLLFALLGLAAITLTRYFSTRRLAVFVLSLVHGVAGLLIFGLPLALSLRGVVHPGFALVSLGGALTGVGGLMLSFLGAANLVKTGSSIFPCGLRVSKEKAFSLLPSLLLVTTAAFTAGFFFNS